MAIKCGNCKERHASADDVRTCYYWSNPPQECECEIDWNCGLHPHGPTRLELINHEFASAQSAIDAAHGM